MMIVKNQVIIILGGSGKLGQCFAENILKKSGKVVIVDSLKPKFNSSLINKDFIFIEKKLSTENCFNDCIKIANKKFKKIDAVINCLYPGSNLKKNKFENIKKKEINSNLTNHLGLTILALKTFFRYFKKIKRGNIINMSSIQGISAPKFEHYKNTNMISPIEYTAIKSGVILMTKYLAKYAKNQNIRVNSISPGGIKSGQNKIFLQKYKKSCLNKGMLDPQDIVGTVLFLLSDYSKYINGQNIIIDDGWSL